MGGRVDVIRNEDYDYLTEFYKVRGDKTKHKERVGKLQGFLLGGRCRMNGVGKMKPIRAYRRQFPDARYYVGIAADEPKRLERLTKENISLLAKYGYTEQDAFRKCEEYGLLSPIYASARRNGCWFCPNRRPKDFLLFRDKHPELWAELAALDKVPNRVSPYFCYDSTFEQLNNKLDWMKRQLTLF